MTASCQEIFPLPIAEAYPTSISTKAMFVFSHDCADDAGPLRAGTTGAVLNSVSFSQSAPRTASSAE